MPLALVVISLAALALLPFVMMRHTAHLRTHISDEAQPARALVTEIQNAITLESAATRAFLLTGDPASAEHQRRARAVRHRASDSLQLLADRIDPGGQTAFSRLSASIHDAEPALDSLLTGTIPRGEYAVRLTLQQRRLERVVEAAADMDRVVASEVADTLRRLRRAELLWATMTVAFVLLAIVAAGLVARLTRRYQESEARFRQMAEAIHDCVWLTDPRFTTQLFVNEAYERIWGRSRQELYENPGALLEGVHPDDRERVRDAISRAPSGPSDLEYRVLRPDGQIRWVWSRGFPVLDKSGRVYRIAGITEDITERKLAAESRTRLIRGFTHDVKNPLGAADGYLALLQEGIDGPLGAKQLESVARIRRALRSALNLVTQLLDIARAEAGQLEVVCAPMDVQIAAREVLEEFRGEARSKEIALRADGDGNGLEPLIISSDYARVRQVIANLISNAVKYTKRGGRVMLHAETSKNADRTGGPWWATITVSDNGPGIPPEKQNMLFREFTRFDPKAAAGSGIGLAISQRVARALGGTITFRSEVGSGSSFTLWLPATPQNDEGDLESPTPSHEASTRS